MNITTILLFLIGDREAILQIAADRWTLAIGFLFVLSAAFARNYARHDLRREPWHLAIPFVVSIVSSLALLAWLFVVAWWHEATIRGFVTHYLDFLGLYWLTAPLAWLYAMPVERWMSRGASVKTRLAMLGVVAVWRVALIVRVLYVIMQADDVALFLATMVYVSGLAVVAIWLTSRRQEQPEPAPEVVAFMGAIPVPTRTERRLIRRAGCFVIAIAVPCFAICGFGLSATYGTAASWQFPDRTLAGAIVPRVEVWLLAGGSILGWWFVLPTTRRLRKRRTLVLGNR